MTERDIAETLPDLERRVFTAIREGGAATVAEVVERLPTVPRRLKYTTVMTVLTRLWQKGFLVRRAEGRAFLYEARPPGDIAGELGGRAAQDALTKYGTPALSGFVRTLSSEQRALLAQLLEDDVSGASEGAP